MCSVPLTAHPAVLVVDDDPAFLHIVPATLMRALPHVAVETCPSAQLAASKLAEGHYDAAVTDLLMPELDGFGVLSHALEARPCTPIVLLQGKKSLSWRSRRSDKEHLTSLRSRWTGTGCYGRLIWLSKRTGCDAASKNAACT